MAGDPAAKSPPPPAEPKAPAAPARRPQVRRTILWTLVAIVAACGLGWGFLAYMESRHPKDAWGEVAPIPKIVPWEANSPTGGVGSPAAAMGLRPLAGDPGGIAPPSGATRASAFERKLSDALEQQARYQWWGEPAEAAAHYRKILQQRGFALASDRVGKQGWRTMVLSSGNIACTVTLQTNPGHGRLVIIVVVVTVASPDVAGKGQTR